MADIVRFPGIPEADAPDLARDAYPAPPPSLPRVPRMTPSTVREGHSDKGDRIVEGKVRGSGGRTNVRLEYVGDTSKIRSVTLKYGVRIDIKKYDPATQHLLSNDSHTPGTTIHSEFDVRSGRRTLYLNTDTDTGNVREHIRFDAEGKSIPEARLTKPASPGVTRLPGISEGARPEDMPRIRAFMNRFLNSDPASEVYATPPKPELPRPPQMTPSTIKESHSDTGDRIVEGKVRGSAGRTGVCLEYVGDTNKIRSVTIKSGIRTEIKTYDPDTQHLSSRVMHSPGTTSHTEFDLHSGYRKLYAKIDTKTGETKERILFDSKGEPILEGQRPVLKVTESTKTAAATGAEAGEAAEAVKLAEGGKLVEAAKLLGQAAKDSHLPGIALILPPIAGAAAVLAADGSVSEAAAAAVDTTVPYKAAKEGRYLEASLQIPEKLLPGIGDALTNLPRQVLHDSGFDVHSPYELTNEKRERLNTEYSAGEVIRGLRDSHSVIYQQIAKSVDANYDKLVNNLRHDSSVGPLPPSLRDRQQFIKTQMNAYLGRIIGELGGRVRLTGDPRLENAPSGIRRAGS